MRSINSVYSIEEPLVSTHAIQHAETHFLEVQSGLAVDLAVSNGAEQSDKIISFPGDKTYIHLNCVLQGQFEAKVKDIPLCYTAGDVSMGFSDGEVFHLNSGQAFCNIEVMITPQLLDEIAGEELGNFACDKDLQFFIRNAGRNPRAMHSAMQIVHLMQQAPRKKLLLHSAILDYIHWHLNAFQTKDGKVLVSARERKQLEMARDYLLQDLSLAPTIADIATEVGLNQCKLKKGFKHLFGDSIYAYFQKERMNHAMQLLRDNNVTDTAVVLGYSNVSHFSAAFRKQFGVLPREARREIVPAG